MRGFFLIELLLILAILWGIWKLLKVIAITANKQVDEALNEKETKNE